MAAPDHTNVDAAAADTQLLAANEYRTGFSVQNDSTATLYLKYASGASATSHAVQVAPGGYFENPPGQRIVTAIYGYWTSATGAARIVEFT